MNSVFRKNKLHVGPMSILRKSSLWAIGWEQSGRHPLACNWAVHRTHSGVFVTNSPNQSSSLHHPTGGTRLRIVILPRLLKTCQERCTLIQFVSRAIAVKKSTNILFESIWFDDMLVLSASVLGVCHTHTQHVLAFFRDDRYVSDRASYSLNLFRSRCKWWISMFASPTNLWSSTFPGISNNLKSTVALLIRVDVEYVEWSSHPCRKP